MTSQQDQSEAREEFRQLIESAYQDVHGVMTGKKGYTYRHDELAEQAMVIANKLVERQGKRYYVKGMIAAKELLANAISKAMSK